MKMVKVFLILCLVGIFQNGFAQTKQTADPILYLTFINAAGEERTKSLAEVKASDLKDSVKHAEFRDGDKAVQVEGNVVYLPKRGGIMPFVRFKNPEELARIMNSFTEIFVPTAGDKLIFDTLSEVESKKTLNSIVFELK